MLVGDDRDDRGPVDVSGGSRRGPTEGAVDWLPPAGIAETSTSFEVTLELCGVPREDIDVHLDEGRLSVWGVRRAQNDDEVCHYRERRLGRFARSFSFRAPVDEERISARLADGVLTLDIPKKLPKKIPLE